MYSKLKLSLLRKDGSHINSDQLLKGHSEVHLQRNGKAYGFVFCPLTSSKFLSQCFILQLEKSKLSRKC